MKLKSFLILLAFGLFIFFLYRISILNLPVFADEAIYIRWSQLASSEWNRYAFLPLNDGKTPLFFWLLAPFMNLGLNPLLVGRLANVIFGVLTIFILMAITHLISGSKKISFISGLMMTILPFWYLHFRMSLLDGPMTFFLASSLYFALKIAYSTIPIKNGKKHLTANFITNSVIFAGILFGLALLTKLTAVVFIPVLLMTVFFPRKGTLLERARLVFQLGVSIGIGMGLFLLLKLHPAFPQLFSRGSDFLWSFQDIIQNKMIFHTIRNIPTYIEYFLMYMTPSFLILIAFSFFFKQYRREVSLLVLQALVFILPIALLGKVVYPRYFLPAVFPLTLAGGLAIGTAFEILSKQSKVSLRHIAIILAFVLLASNSIGMGARYIYAQASNVSETPYVSADRGQYLTEWSSGFGITEVTQLIRDEAKNGGIAVATEGTFGTLPDGILLYLYNTDVTDIRVEGIGQPINAMPEEFLDTSYDYSKVWLVANQNRINMDMSEATLVSEYCRPFEAPCLQVFDITKFRK